MKRRRATSALIAWLAGLALLLGGLLTYSGHVVSDSGQFATRATSTLRNPSMRAVIARGLSSALLHAEPDLVGVQALVKGGADGIVASAPFQGLVEGALYDVHRTVFVRDADTFTVRLANIGVLADAALRRFAPAVASRLPASTSVVLASVRAGEFGRLSDVARTLNSARRAGWWLLIGGLLGLILSVVLAADRIAGVRRCGLVVLCVGLLLAVLYTVARPLVLAQFAAGDARTAAGVVWNAYLADLRAFALVTACAGALVAVCAHVLRRREARSLDDAPRPRQRRRPRTISAPAVRSVAMVVGAALVLGFAGVAAASGIRGTPRLAHPIVACNGYAVLCDRPVDMVAFAATHNSMGSSTESGWLFPNQDGGIAQQLSAGIRGLLIDTHYGAPARRGVATILTAQTRKLATVVDKVGPGFLDVVDRLRESVGFKPTGARQIYLCHAFCEVGATSAQVALGRIRDFLVEHPDQVVVLSIEDDVSPADTAALFRESGLLDLVYQDPAGPSWPTLRQLIEQDRRVIVFGENDTDHVAWYRPQFKLVQETPYHFRNTGELAAASGCRPNRGGTAKPFFLLNNWVDTSPSPRPSNAKVVNAYGTLLERARRCEAERHHLPNLIAVDFYKVGDVLRVTAALNGV